MIAICAACPKSARNCRGPCACTVDGVDITIHASTSSCPLGFFSGTCQRCGGKHDVSACPNPPEVSSPCTGRLDQPGSLIKSIFAAMGITAAPGCGCEEFCDKMNAWGWTGCISNRREIVDWFSKKAKAAKIDISTMGILRLVIAALRKKVPEVAKTVEVKECDGC